MSERLPWFRCFPSALLGALAGMQADEGFVYVVALMRIYETGGPVAETARTLARRTGMTERRAANALAELVSAGKIIMLEDGRIDAESTHEEIAWQQGKRHANSVAGKISAEKRAGKTQRNQRKSATDVEQPFNHIRDKNIDYSETTSLRNPQKARVHEWPSDFEERIWKAYPKKTDRKKSLARLRALYRADKIPFEVIVAGIERLCSHLRDPQYAPTLERWLRDERWTDQHPTGPPRREPSRGGNAMLELAFEAMQEIQEDRHERTYHGEYEIIPPDRS